MINPNEGIELLYTRDCPNWRQALVNLQAALDQLSINDSIRTIPLDTLDQAVAYNFFSSPTIHIDGQDIDQKVSRINKRGLGSGRPYFFGGKSWSVPPIEMIVEGLKRLYSF